MRKVLVCGSREYRDSDVLYTYLDAIHGSIDIEFIVASDYMGASLFALNWAKSRGVDRIEYKTNFDPGVTTVQARAIRNQRIFDEEEDLCCVIMCKGDLDEEEICVLADKYEVPWLTVPEKLSDK